MSDDNLDDARRAMRRRLVVFYLCVLVWIGLGFAFSLRGNAYLLIGVPITVAFQRFIARRPLRAAWLRADASFRLRAVGVVVAVVLASTPAYDLVRLVAARHWVVAGWNVAAIIGAVGAGYAAQAIDRATLRRIAACCVVTVAVGSPFLLVAYVAHGKPPIGWVRGLHSLVVYLPALFVLEEVFFRGVADSFVDGDNRFGWRSALPVAIVWGLWHLPVVPAGLRFQGLGSLVLVHAALGIPLALFWRRSGNLWPVVAAHALLDAVRNAMLG